MGFLWDLPMENDDLMGFNGDWMVIEWWLIAKLVYNN